MESESSKRVLAAIPDLFFGSKVSGSARQVGARVEFAASREALLAGAQSRPDLVIVDLEAAGLDPVGSIRTIRSESDVRLVAFAGHARGALLEEARAAGCDEIYTRGSLAARLPGLLSSI